MRRRAYLVIWMLTSLLVFPRAANAQSQAGVALAETLYQQARDLMSEGRYDEACPKLEESQRLDPATGTLLNLASCHENQGKFATAWFEYLDAVTMARRDARPDRVAFAQGRLAELEPKLSRLTIMVPKEVDYPGLELELDGARIGLAARGVPTPVDPGPHVVEARAPGRQSVRLTVAIGTVAEQKTLTLPELPATTAEPATPPPAATPSRRDEALPERLPAERPVPASAYVSGAVTAGLLVGAIVTGTLYVDRKHDYERTRTESDYDGARALGVVNAVLWIGVASGAGLTTYLYVTRPETPRAAGADPAILPAGAVAHFAGRF